MRWLFGILLACSGLALVGCDGDAAVICPGRTTRRCLWNEATQQFDRGCVMSCAPAAAGAACGAGSDAGTDVSEARTSYYANDPRLDAAVCPD
jgi:hypothetical protein